MAESVFGNKSEKPSASELEKALGKSNLLLKSIETHLQDKLGEIEREWKFYSKKAGWTFALIHKGRRLLHLIPRSEFFTVVITLGMKAVKAYENIGLSPQILSAIKDAKQYAEGKSIRLDIRSENDVEPVKQLLSIKII
ncbi:MAG: DUF3788 family protein [Desulfobacteraceae bacterium]|jgi:hypothetical protein